LKAAIFGALMNAANDDVYDTNSSA
jgi:hypothetical protein